MMTPNDEPSRRPMTPKEEIRRYKWAVFFTKRNPKDHKLYSGQFGTGVPTKAQATAMAQMLMKQYGIPPEQITLEVLTGAHKGGKGPLKGFLLAEKKQYSWRLQQVGRKW
jgi:hypothetical protein